jgi:hypothetical protein
MCFVRDIPFEYTLIAMNRFKVKLEPRHNLIAVGQGTSWIPKLVTGNFLRMLNLIITSFINHDSLNGHRKGVLDYWSVLLISSVINNRYRRRYK